MFPRFPPHLMALGCLLLVVVWIILVHHFRRNRALHQFVSETLGEASPDAALHSFEAARQRLLEHLANPELEDEVRERIEQSLGETSSVEPARLNARQV